MPEPIICCSDPAGRMCKTNDFCSKAARQKQDVGRVCRFGLEEMSWVLEMGLQGLNWKVALQSINRMLTGTGALYPSTLPLRPS